MIHFQLIISMYIYRYGSIFNVSSELGTARNFHFSPSFKRRAQWIGTHSHNSSSQAHFYPFILLGLQYSRYFGNSAIKEGGGLPVLE